MCTEFRARSILAQSSAAANRGQGWREKRRRSCQDTLDVPPSDNGSEDTSLGAVTDSGAGSGRGACSLMPRFLLNHVIFDHGLVDGLGPDQPRLQGNLLCGKDWTQLRKIAVSEWVILPVQEVPAHPWCTECEHLRSRICLEEPPGQVGSLRLDAVVQVHRWPLYRVSGQLQRLGTRTPGVTPGRTRSLRISRLIAGVFCPGPDSFYTSSSGPLGIGLEVLSPKSIGSLSQHGSENRKSDLVSGHSLLLGQKQWAPAHSVATQNTIHMTPYGTAVFPLRSGR